MSQEGRGHKINIVLVFSLPLPCNCLSHWQMNNESILNFAACYLLLLGSEPCCQSQTCSGRDWLICFLCAMSSLCSSRTALVSLQYARLVCSCVILTPVNNVQTHKISILLSLDHKVLLLNSNWKQVILYILNETNPSLSVAEHGWEQISFQGSISYCYY